MVSENPVSRMDVLTQKDKDLRSFIYLAFKYGQGENLALQPQLITYGVKNKLLLPENIPVSVPPFLLDMHAPSEHVGLGQQSEDADSEEVRKTQIREICGMLRERVHGKSESIFKYEGNPKTILNLLLRRDIYYQSFVRPRNLDGIDPHTIKPDSLKDEHASYIRAYVLSGKPAGHPVFDALFDEIRGLMAGYKDGVAEDETDVKNIRRIEELQSKRQAYYPDYDLFAPLSA